MSFMRPESRRMRYIREIEHILERYKSDKGE